MSLQDTLDSFKSDFESGKPPYNVPAELLAIMHRSTEELKDSKQAERAAHVGSKIPAFEIQTADGDFVSSDQVLKNGPLVISFYRGVWCPYCNLELKALEAARPEIQGLGAKLVAISPQTAVNSRKSQKDNGLNFPILIDSGNNFARKLGLVFRLPDYLINDVYMKFGTDLAAFNGDESWELPMPARYVVGQDSTILYSEVNPDYSFRPDPSELLPILKSAKSASS